MTSRDQEPLDPRGRACCSCWRRLVIVPCIATKSTRSGLDLKGGIELVYQGQPTPQVPTVTPQALDDAIDTIRKRTDALGVSEPEIQRSGRDQISIGLPDVQNAAARQRAGGHDGAAPVLRLGAERPRRPRAGRPVRGLQGALRGRRRGLEAEAEGREGRRAAGLGPDAGRGRQAERLHRRPVLPVRPRPPADRPRQAAAPRGQVRPVLELQGPAVRLRRRAGSAEQVREGHGVQGGARGARPGRPAGRHARHQGARRASWSWRPSRRRTSRRAYSASS